jgi:hypothetical protein
VASKWRYATLQNFPRRSEGPTDLLSIWSVLQAAQFCGTHLQDYNATNREKQQILS